MNKNKNKEHNPRKIYQIACRCGLWFFLAIVVFAIALNIVVMWKTDPVLLQVFLKSCIYSAALILIIGVFFVRFYGFQTGGRSLISDLQRSHSSFQSLILVFSADAKKKINLNEFPKAPWQKCDGLILGKCGGYTINRPTAAEGNALVFARPGDGKTSSQIIPSAKCFAGSVFAIDIKSDITNAVPERHPLIFNLIDPSQSAHFDPFAALRGKAVSETIEGIQVIAQCIIPDERGENSAYFVQGARDYFCGAFLHYFDQNPTISFPALCSRILMQSFGMLTNEIMNGNSIQAKTFVASYRGTNEKNVGGAYNKLCTCIRLYTFPPLSNLLDGSGECITPKALEAGRDVYITVAQETMSLYAPMLSLVVDQFLNAFYSRKDSATGTDLQPILFLLDEYPQLKFSYERIMTAIATLRSKRVTLFLAAQSFSQLHALYGDGARAILDNCAFVSVMSAQDPENATYFSRLFGNKHEIDTSISVSQNRNNATSNSRIIEVPVLPPESFMDLDKVAILYKGKYILADKTYYFLN